MEVSIRPGTSRNTRATIVQIGQHAFYFSYRTCVAYRGPRGCARIENHWGPTTGRHLREMGVYDWQVLTDDAFKAFVEREVGGSHE